MLDAEDITAYYGAVAAVRNTSINVKRGEIVGVLGANGAGKSTLLGALSGFVRSTGDVEVDGVDVSTASTQKRRKVGLGFVPQSDAVVAGLTVAENLRLSWVTGKRSEAFDSTRASALETFPVLSDRLDEPAGNLSGGQRQMLAVSRGLMSRCDVLMLDEPTAGLSPKLVREVGDAVLQLGEKGLTILLVEQNLSVVERTCSRTYILSGGELAWSGDISTLDRDRVAELYAGAN